MASSTIRIKNELSTPQRYICALFTAELGVSSTAFVIATPPVEPNSSHDVTFQGGLYLWATAAGGTDVQVLCPVTPCTIVELEMIDENPAISPHDDLAATGFVLTVNESFVGGTFGLGMQNLNSPFRRLTKSDASDATNYTIDPEPLLKVATSQAHNDGDELDDTIDFTVATSFKFPADGEHTTLIHRPHKPEDLLVSKETLDEDPDEIGSAVGQIDLGSRTHAIANIRNLLFEGSGADLPQRLASMAVALGATTHQRRGLEQRIKEYEASILRSLKTDPNEGLRPSSANALSKKVPEPRLPSGYSIAATAWSPMHIRVYFQDAEGAIRELRYDNNVWSGGDVTNSTIIGLKTKCRLETPLAVIQWDNGQQIRLYYVTGDDILQEHCYSAGIGWYPGDLNSMQIRVDHNSKIAALHWPNGCNIRVYVQEPLKRAIQEFAYGNSFWQRGESLRDARSGSSIAATRWITGPIDHMHRNVHIRIYYQDDQSLVRQLCWHVGGWFQGESRFSPSPYSQLPPYHLTNLVMATGRYCQKALSTTSIAVLAWHGDGIQIRVFFQDLLGHLVEHKFNGDWASPERVKGSFDDASPFGAVQVQNGRHLRLYQRDRGAGALVEKCHGAMSTYWWQGGFGGA